MKGYTTGGMKIDRWHVTNHDGWDLALRRTTWEPSPAGRRPLLIVPGYGMNSFIFGFHPRGKSLEGYLAWRGFEVWAVDLRGQGQSRRKGPRKPYGLEDLALVDLAAAVGAVLERTATGASRVDVIGCSLGATLMFAQAAVGRDRRMASLVSLGGPLRWEKIHPALRWAFSSPALAGALPFRGTRALAGVALPLLVRLPKLLSVYMNTSVTDTSRAAEMVQTVEDPIPRINGEIAVWMKSRDLTVRGENLTTAMGSLRNPLLCVVASADGIVPPETVLSAREAIGSDQRDVLTVGDRDTPIAHADLFLCNEAERLVFEPLAQWLAGA